MSGQALKEESNYDRAVRELEEIEHKRFLFRTNRKEFKKLVAKEQEEKRLERISKGKSCKLRPLTDSKYWEILHKVIDSKAGDIIKISTPNFGEGSKIKMSLLRYSQMKRIPQLSISRHINTITITILNSNIRD